MKVFEKKDIRWIEGHPDCTKCHHLMIKKDYKPELKCNVYKCPNPDCGLEIGVKTIL
jgi:hypothetical protein